MNNLLWVMHGPCITITMLFSILLIKKNVIFHLNSAQALLIIQLVWNIQLRVIRVRFVVHNENDNKITKERGQYISFMNSFWVMNCEVVSEYIITSSRQ